MPEGAAMWIEVVAVGLSTPESAPLYHYRPGSVSLRLYTGPRGLGVSYDCGGVGFDVCEWLEKPASFPRYRVRLDVLRRLGERWGAESVILDGLESWSYANIVSSVGLPLVVRSQGLEKPSGEVLSLVDALIADYTYPILGKPELNSSLGETVRLAYSMGVWVEAAAYMESPLEPEMLAPALDAIEPGTPLHVFIADPMGGGPVSRLWKTLSSSHWPVYIHSPPYSQLDTFCPSCGTVLATRSEGVLTALELAQNGGCPRCGREIPLRGGWRRSTPRRLRAVAPEGVYWLDPRSLGGVPTR